MLLTITSAKVLPTKRAPQKIPHQLLTATSLYPRNARKALTLVHCKADDEQKQELRDDSSKWRKMLPERSKPLYSHSLPCIEAWLTSLDFNQSTDDRAVWFIQKNDWHAQLSLDLTDLYVRYLKSGPGNLEKDVERRFSYALSREDIENAVLGGP